jgi:peptidoglycan hydrolase-like protein with peptidoglycan-binding domain
VTGKGGGVVSGPLSIGYVAISSAATTTIGVATTSAIASPSAGQVATSSAEIATTGALTLTFAKNLGLGTADTDVQALQQFLNSRGFSIAASGPGSLGNETDYFGSLTQTALTKFQSSNSISPATGYFGALTRTVVNELSGNSPSAPNIFADPLTLGITGTEVTALQQLLVNLGFLSTTPTGYYGTLTFEAVKAFQAAHQLEEVGSIGPQTRAVLNAIENGSTTSSTN